MLLESTMLNTDVAYGKSYNDSYLGAKAWAALNLEANMFSILPKYSWDRSGWGLFNEKH